MHKSKIKYTLFAVLFFIILLDVVFTFTPIGSKLHTIVLPPDITIYSYPSGATATVVNKNNDILVHAKLTPFSLRALKTGMYTVLLSKQDFNAVTRTMIVNDSSITFSGGSVRVEADQAFIPLTAVVAIDSMPAGAEIIIDDTLQPLRTPAVVTLEVGEHVIMLRKTGFGSNEAAHNGYPRVVIDPGKLLDEQPGLDPNLWTLYKTVINSSTTFHLKGILVKYFTIDSVPRGAAFFIDQEKDARGYTPVPFVGINAGNHTLRMSLPGYQQVEKKISVDDSSSDYLVTVFNKMIRFSAYEKGRAKQDINARVTIPGTTIIDRITPFKTELPDIEWQAVFSKEPNYKVTQTVFDANKVDSVSAFLQKNDTVLHITTVENTTGKPVSGAEIMVNAEHMGVTDALGRISAKVFAGNHVINVASFDDYKEKKDTIITSGSRQVLLTIRLDKKEDCTLIIDTKLHFSGAKIYIDGAYKGESVKKITRLSRDRHVIRISHQSLAGYAEKEVIFKGKETRIFTVNKEGKLVSKDQ